MIDLTAHGFDQAAKMIDGIGHRGRNATPALSKVSNRLQKSEQALWGRRGGVKWAPHPDGSKAGVKTGDLEASLTQDNAPGAIRIVTRDHMIYGTSLWYAVFMQVGTTVKGKKHAPKRPVLIFRPIDRRYTREVLAAHLLGEQLPDTPSSRKRKAT